MQPSTRFWIAIYSFTAFIMLIAISVFGWLAWESHKEGGAGRTANAQPTATGHVPEERYQLLSRFVPPPYQPTSVADHSKQFRQGMEKYAKGDDAGAITDLRAAAETQPDSVEARFYLGICLLLNDQSDAGMAELRRVIALGDGPYLERARFYLAKALIGKRDIGGARRELDAVIAMHGEMEKQAQVLVRQIGS